MLLDFAKGLWPGKPAHSLWDSHDIIREELFGVERLEAHARSLAYAQPVDAKWPGWSLSRHGWPATAQLCSAQIACHDAELVRGQVYCDR